GQISLTSCCSVAGLGYGRSGSFDYYVKEPVVENDLKGVGPLILAGIELQQLLGLPITSRPGTVTATATATASVTVQSASKASEWSQLPAILARIKAPTFPKREFQITKYGAATDGSDSTAAIAEAIDACAKAGGGRVVVPAGEFLTGAIHLKSNVELHLE